MASDRDSKQDRRRSFFLFGNVNLGRSDQIAKSTNANRRKSLSSKQNSTKRPLERQPLNNKNPFLDNSTPTSSVAVQHDSTPGNEQVLTSQVPTKQVSTNVLEPEKRANRNPFLNESSFPSTPGTKMRVRKPPPPIDLSAIRVLTQSTPQDTVPAKDRSQPSSAEETLKSTSHSPIKTPVPSKVSLQKHRRQRSEAEKLVDDLEEYIMQHEDSKSLDLNAGDVEKLSESDHDNLSTDESSSEPSAYVEPLNLGLGDVNGEISFTRGSLQSRSDAELDMDTDRFSFTDSLNDKSVNSIQQVAMSEVTGAAPILMNLHYGSPSVNSGNDGRSSVSVRSAFRDANAKPFSVDGHFSSSEDEFQEVAQQSVSRLPTQSGGSSPKRAFRVVNEDRPQFYLQTADNTTVSTTDSTTTDDDDDDDHDQELGAHGATSDAFRHSQRVENPATSVSPVLSYTSSRVEGKDGSQEINKAFEADTLTPLQEFNNIGSLLDAGALTVTEEDAIDKSTSVGNVAVCSPAIHSNPSLKSGHSNYTTSSGSSKPDKTVRLVSSYVEELRLKYYRSSNFLAAPPNLPISLKQKNNLIQPKNIKVRIRTSSKQIGIKHGGAKQKLLSLETANEDSGESYSSASKNRINVDHTKEFHDLLAKESQTNTSNEATDLQNPSKNDDYYLRDIPGDDAYDSDDAMAPLRERNGSRSSQSVGRSNTVVSYYTKNQRRFRSGTLDNGYAHLQDLPTDIDIRDYEDKISLDTNDPEAFTVSDDSSSIAPAPSYGLSQGLHVANPDTDLD